LRRRGSRRRRSRSGRRQRRRGRRRRRSTRGSRRRRSKRRRRYRKRKEAEEAEKKREEEHKRKQAEEEQKEEKRKEAEDAEKKMEEEEEEEEHKRKQLEDYRSYKAPNVNVSTYEPIFLSSQESTDTLPTGKKEGRQDYVTREVLGVDENDQPVACKDLKWRRLQEAGHRSCLAGDKRESLGRPSNMPVAVAVAGSEALGLGSRVGFSSGFPTFLPQEVEWIRDPAARRMARRIERLPVQISFADSPIMSSCVRPFRQQAEAKLPVVLLHGFDSSCLEWSYSYPLLEDAGLETWALDVLGWGFSELGALSRCHVDAKREHLYQLWRSYIRKPMILVGPSLGAAMAIDFAAHYPKAVSNLVLINASVYAEGTGILARLPRLAAYAGVSLLKSMPLRFYANTLAFKDISFFSNIDWTNVTGHEARGDGSGDRNGDGGGKGAVAGTRRTAFCPYRFYLMTFS
ncbi:hypothetical protein Taro_003017, partial [Colocasia esculenta]|nr:hypothetical protein [Colocasia esculenta]